MPENKNRRYDGRFHDLLVALAKDKLFASVKDRDAIRSHRMTDETGEWPG